MSINLYGTFYCVNTEDGLEGDLEESDDTIGTSSITTFGSSEESEESSTMELESSSELELETSSTYSENSNNDEFSVIEQNEIGGYGTVDLETTMKDDNTEDSEDSSEGVKSISESENIITGYGTVNLDEESALEKEIPINNKDKKLLVKEKSENQIAGYGTINESEEITEKSENQIAGYGTVNENEETTESEISSNEIGGYGTVSLEDSESEIQSTKKINEKKRQKLKQKTKPSSTRLLKQSFTKLKDKTKEKNKDKRRNNKQNILSISQGSDSESKPAFNTNNCYWNTEFQRALDMTEGRAQWTKLAKLAHDFVYCSKTYGKIIITEYYLPENEKTIKSIDAGGLAGGSKYICSNIFFKFALDTDLTKDVRKKKNLSLEELPSMWMYGGAKPDDYAAMKAAKNDMTGLMSYYNAKIPGLYFPLMSLIDYRGFRLIAMSILPISRGTIRYGSADGGKTIHKQNKEINNKMQEVAELLNLKGHRTGLQRVMVWGPGDIEAHEGRDNKYYVVDFGRTFPPEAPSEAGSRKIFYCLLRPEFVRMYEKPLSSDAFSCWGKCNSRIHNQEVRDATNYLYEIVIPKFAKELYEKKVNVSDIRLTESLHSSGINCRHLGRVRSALPSEAEDLSRLLITEMVARLLSGLLRQLLRIEMKRTKVASQEPYKTVVIDFLNAILFIPATRSVPDVAPILNNDPRLSFRLSPEQLEGLSSEISKVTAKDEIKEINMGVKTLQEVDNCSYLRGTYFWIRDIKDWLETKFTLALTRDEKQRRYNLRDSIDQKLLLRRLCEQSGIKLSKHAMEEFYKFPDDFQVLNFDLRKVSARVKHLNVIDEAEGNLLFLEARNHSHREGLWDATNTKFARAVCSNTNNPATFVRWGSILLKQCKHFRTKPDSNLLYAEKLLEEAEEKFLSALKLNPRMHEAKFELGNTFVFRGTLAHLYKPEDTIAVSLWNFEDAMRYYFSAFSSDPKYFQKILISVDELSQQAQSLRNPLPAVVRSELYLRGFFMLHCGISVAPQIPDSTTFMQAAILLKEYLTCGGSPSVGNYIYGLASSYFESAFLKIPSAFDGQLVYFHQKSLYQIQRCGTQPNLSSIRKSEDVVLLYKIEEKSKNSEQKLCSLFHSIEMNNVVSDFPLMFYPVITEDPSSNYHQVRSINRLFHLGNMEWDSICKEGEYPQLPIIRINKAACTFTLCHSPFYAFSITRVKIIIPKLDGTIRNVGLPSKISLYGSNSKNRWNFTEPNIQDAISGDKDATELLKIFHIHTQEINSTGDSLTIDIEIPSTIKYSRFLVIHIIPSPNAKEVGLCKLSFRGHQVYISNLPHAEKLEPNLRRTMRANAKKVLLHDKKKKSNTSWESGCIRPNLSTRVSWNSNHSDMLSLDPTGHTIRTDDYRSLGKSGGRNTRQKIFTCQCTIPISYASAPAPIQKKTPLLRNLASIDLTASKRASTLSLQGISEGPYLTLWVDHNHHSNETRTLCQLARDQCKKLELLKFKSTSGVIDWLEERTANDSDTSMELLSLSGYIKLQNFRIVSSHICNNNTITLEDALSENELWKKIPLMIYNSDINVLETTTHRDREDREIFNTNCARATVEFASFQLLPSDLSEIPINRTGTHRFFNTRSEKIPITNNITRSKRTMQLGKFTKPDTIFYYFEITILQLKEASKVSIGLAPNEFPNEAIKLGTTPLSFAFKSTGTLWCGWSNKHCKFPSKSSFTFKQNDIIGCGYDVRSQTIFWTKNGKYLGPAERGHSRLLNHNTKLYPSVTIHGKATLRANFGKTRFLFDLSKLSSFTHPKLSNPNKKERISTIHPFSSELFTGALEKHNMHLLILSVLAQFSRSLNLLLRAHISHWQEHKLPRASVSMALVDSPDLRKTIPMAQISYEQIDLTNTLDRASDLHMCSLWSLMSPKRPSTLDVSNWTTLSSNVFKRILHPEIIHSLHLTNCKFDDTASTIISERLLNLKYITLWNTITSQGIISICSMPSLRKIDFSNCQELTDSVLLSAIRKSSRDSFELLNFYNCNNLTDHGLQQLVSKAASVIKNLRSLNLDYCDKVTTTGVLKMLNCCKQLQHVNLASNPSTNGMTDNIVRLIAEEYNQKLQTLVLVRSTNITPLSIEVLSSKCHNLTHLDLAHCNNLTDDSLAILAESGSNLIKLDLFNTCITDKTALKFVKNHQHLRYISFSRCNSLSSYGIIACFSHMKEVEFLSLRENNLRDEVLRALATSNLPRLVLVDISSCVQISQEVVKSLQLQLSRVLVNTSHEKSKKYQTT